MKNIITCKNCGTENPFFGLICLNCKSFIREKIYNIDLWKVLGLLVENPRKGFQLIIQSEHKNFIFFILILASIKFTIDSVYLSLITIKPEPVLGGFLKNYLIIIAGTSVITFIISLLLNLINSAFGLVTRIKDNFASLTYSFVPQVYALVLLFIVEVTVFGGNLFSKNPSVFDLKELLAYVLLGFEILVIIWGIILSVMALFTQTKNLIYSVVSGLVFNFSIYYFLYLISLNY